MEVRDIVEETRREVVMERRGTQNLTPDEERNSVIGYCVENAEVLAERLNENGFEARIVKGGLDLPNEPTPDSYERAGKDGTRHHWVVVQLDNVEIHCDLAREGRLEHGYQPMIRRGNPPSEYIEFYREG